MENGEYSSRHNDYDDEDDEDEALAREMERARECDDDNEDDESSQNNFGPPHSGSGGPDGPGLLGPGSYGGPNFGPPGPWGRGFPPRGPRYVAEELEFWSDHLESHTPWTVTKAVSLKADCTTAVWTTAQPDCMHLVPV